MLLVFLSFELPPNFILNATDLKLGSSTYFFLLFSFLCQVLNLRVATSRDQVLQKAHSIDVLRSTPINLHFSVTYLSFYFWNQLLLGNVKEDLHTSVLSPPITTRYVRINPQHWNRGVCMKTELYGCSVGKGEKLLFLSRSGTRFFRNTKLGQFGWASYKQASKQTNKQTNKQTKMYPNIQGLETECQAAIIPTKPGGWSAELINQYRKRTANTDPTRGQFNKETTSVAFYNWRVLL